MSLNDMSETRLAKTLIFTFFIRLRNPQADTSSFMIYMADETK